LKLLVIAGASPLLSRILIRERRGNVRYGRRVRQRIVTCTEAAGTGLFQGLDGGENAGSQEELRNYGPPCLYVANKNRAGGCPGYELTNIRKIAGRCNHRQILPLAAFPVSDRMKNGGGI